MQKQVFARELTRLRKKSSGFRVVFIYFLVAYGNQNLCILCVVTAPEEKSLAIKIHYQNYLGT